MDMATSIKLCGLCSQLVDESVDIGVELRNFLDGFLVMPHLPTKMCLECYQGATQCIRFKQQCLKSSEKLLKCKLATSMILGSPVNSLEHGDGKFYSEVSSSKSNTSQRSEEVIPLTAENPMVINVTSPINSQCSSQEEIVDIETSSLEMLENNESTSDKAKVGIINTSSTSIDESLKKSGSQIRSRVSKLMESVPFEEVVPMTKRLRSQDSIQKPTSKVNGSANTTPVSQKGLKIGPTSTSKPQNSKTHGHNVKFDKTSTKAPTKKSYPATPFKANKDIEFRVTRSGNKFPQNGKGNTVTLTQTTTSKPIKSANKVIEPSNIISKIRGARNENRVSQKVDKKLHGNGSNSRMSNSQKRNQSCSPKRTKRNSSSDVNQRSLSAESKVLRNSKCKNEIKDSSQKKMIVSSDKPTSKTQELQKSTPKQSKTLQLVPKAALTSKTAKTPVGNKKPKSPIPNNSSKKKNIPTYHDKEVTVDPHGSENCVSNKNSITKRTDKPKTVFKTTDITPKEPIKKKRKKSDSNSSLISPPAKVIKAEKWVGPKGGSWKGWALVEINDNECKDVIPETPTNTLRTSRGRAIKARKLSDYDFNDSAEKIKDELSEKLGHPSDTEDNEWIKKEKKEGKEVKREHKPIPKPKSVKKLKSESKRENKCKGSPLPGEVDIVSENDLNLANEEESFPPCGPYQCEICQMITETKYQFVSHIKQSHPDVVDEEVMSSLERDLLIQSKRALLQKHIKTSTKKEANNSKNDSAQSTSDGKKFCNNCGMTISKGTKLAAHQKSEKCRKAASKKCKYCHVFIHDESMDIHYQSDSCRAARYLLDQTEGNNAAKLITTDDINEIHEELPEKSSYSMPDIMYENTQTIHPQYEYDELMGVSTYNSNNNDDNMITFNSNKAATSYELNVQNGVPTVSTAADSTTVVCTDPTKPSNSLMNDALTNLVNDTVSSMSMPLIETSQMLNDSISITRIDEQIASVDLMDSKVDDNSVAQPTLYDIPGAGFYNDNMTYDVITTVVETTVTSSQHQTNELSSTRDTAKINDFYSNGNSAATTIDFPTFDQLDGAKDYIEDGNNLVKSADNKEEYYDMINTPLMDDMINTPVMDDMINTPVVEDMINNPIMDDMINTPVMDDMINTPVMDDMMNTPVMEDMIDIPEMEDIQEGPKNDLVKENTANPSIIDDKNGYELTQTSNSV